MAALSPAKILKLWNRVNDRFGPEEEDKKEKKKLSPKAKQADKESTRIQKGLTRLRLVARGNMEEPSTVGKFEKTRDKTTKSMKKYCKLLKSNDLKETVKDLTKLRKAMKQLTIVVELLEVGGFGAEEGDVDLNALNDVDTTKLDKAMEDPNFGEYSDEELAELDTEETEESSDETEEEEEAPEETEEIPEAPPEVEEPKARPGTLADVYKFTKRLKTLMPAIQKSQKEKAPAAAQITQRVKEANAAAQKKDVVQAHALLDRVEWMLKNGPEPEPDPMALFTKRLKALMPAIQKAQAAPGEEGKEIKLRVSEANTFARKKDFVQANALLDTVEKLLKPKAKEPSQNGGAEFTARLKRLMPALQKAKTQKTPEAKEVNLRFSEANVFARKKDFAQANKLLDQVEKLLKPRGEPSQNGEGEFTKRLKALMPALQMAKGQKTPEASEVNLRVSEASTFARKKDYSQANALLDKVEALLKQFVGAVSGEEGEEEDEKETKTAVIWRKASDTVGQQLSKLQTTLRGSDDPELKIIADRGLNGITKRLKVGLQVALMEYDMANGGAKQTAASRALAAVADFQKFLQSNKLIPLLEENPFGVPVSIRKTMGSAFTRLNKMLRG